MVCETPSPCVRRYLDGRTYLFCLRPDTTAVDARRDSDFLIIARTDAAATLGFEAAVERARKAHRGDDMGEIKAAFEELSTAYQEAGRSLYAQQQAAGEPPADGTGDAAGAGASGEAPKAKADDVVEADYEIVDEPKKS